MKLKLLFSFSILLIITKATFGCDCTPPDFNEAFKEADAVFMGEVVSIEKQKFHYFHFKIERFWKGSSASEVILASGTTFKYGDYTAEITFSSCFISSFEKGEKYLVFAKQAGEHWIARTCSRTSKVTNNDEDLIKLGKGKSPKTKKKSPK